MAVYIIEARSPLPLVGRVRVGVVQNFQNGNELYSVPPSSPHPGPAHRGEEEV